ncbi:MAG: hypothetical protein KC613_20695, partial [Myxococcales bacterium]|nr:hypothetical protein [Myxococcales bacterium]
ERLVRGKLAELRPEQGVPAVRLALSGPGTGALAAVIQEPVIRDAQGRHAAFAVVQDPAAPALTVQVTRTGDRLAVKGGLGAKAFEAQARAGDWLSLLPPLVALLLAVAFRHVVVALLSAVLVGAVVLQGGNPAWALWLEIKSLALAPAAFFGAEVTLDGYLGRVIADSFNLQILGFTFALVGLVALVGRMGGTRGLVDRLSRFARGPRSAQAVTSFMGTALFFDDYANTVVVGTTGRSLTDRNRISREKLAYIVDSTSAPVAGVAIVSTWIGYEVGLFDDLLAVLATVPDLPKSGYELFFQVLPLRFYCLFALALVFLGALTGRDMGAMLKAERRARSGGPLAPGKADAEGPEQLEAPGVVPRARNAIIPIGAVLAAIVAWIIWGGSAGMASFSPLSLADWKAVFEADYVADNTAFILLGSALIGSGVAFALALIPRTLTVRDAGKAYLSGLSTLAEAAAVLILAWAIKSVCDELGTGMALVALIGDALPPVALPVTVFVLAGLVAFATGTSWGTMALVLPVAAPLAATLSGEPLVVYACLGAVLDGAIWGDHCSPISDTTVLSSTASGCPHLAHVRTQFPYATLAMVAAGAAGYVGVVVGVPVWAAYPLGLGIMAGGLYVFGRRVDAA